MKNGLILVGMLALALAGTEALPSEFAGQAAALTSLAETRIGLSTLAASFSRLPDYPLGLKCDIVKYESRPAETAGHLEPITRQDGTTSGWRWVPARGAEYSWRVTMTQVPAGTKVWNKEGLKTEYEGNVMFLQCFDTSFFIQEVTKYQAAQARPHPALSCKDLGKGRVVLVDETPAGTVILWETTGLFKLDRTAKEECSYRMEVVEALGIK